MTQVVLLTTPGDGYFTVPTGVSSLIVEVWGAGGSQAVGATTTISATWGEAGGGYAKVNAMPVTAGQVIGYFISDGSLATDEVTKFGSNGSGATLAGAYIGALNGGNHANPNRDYKTGGTPLGTYDVGYIGGAGSYQYGGNAASSSGNGTVGSSATDGQANVEGGYGGSVNGGSPGGGAGPHGGGTSPLGGTGQIRITYNVVQSFSGTTTFKKPSASASLTTIAEITGAASFKKPTASGAAVSFTELVSAASLKKPTASGALHQTAQLTGSTTFKKPTGSGAETQTATMTGSTVFKKPTALGRLITGSLLASSLETVRVAAEARGLNIKVEPRSVSVL